MTHTENSRENYTNKFGEPINSLTATVERLTVKFEQVELSLIVSKTVNDSLTNRVTSFERNLHALEQYSRRECLEINGIRSSFDN